MFDGSVRRVLPALHVRILGAMDGSESVVLWDAGEVDGNPNLRASWTAKVEGWVEQGKASASSPRPPHAVR